jgi:hypothetical protein
MTQRLQLSGAKLSFVAGKVKSDRSAGFFIFGVKSPDFG